MQSMWIAVIFVSFFYICKGDSDDFRQEAAKVEYSDPEYVKDIKLLTHRATRNSPYLTSGNATLIYPWENNVTVMAECYNARTKHEIFSLEFKVCEAIKITWVKEWTKKYSNIPSHCPVPAMTVRFDDIEVPPKNFPIPLPEGDYTISLVFTHTKTKNKILDIKLNLRSKKKATGK